MAPGGVENIISTNIITKLKLAASKKLLKPNFFDAPRAPWFRNFSYPWRLAVSMCFGQLTFRSNDVSVK
jgi:hypothetical protein